MFRSLLHLLFLLPLVVHAQPQGNIDCATAAVICAQQPVTGNNTGVVGTIPSFCQGTDNALWYSFTTNSAGGVVTLTLSGISCPVVPGAGNALTAVVLAGDGSCAPAGFTAASSCTSGSNDFTVTTDPLAPLTTYWVLIAGVLGQTGAAQCDFTLEFSGEGADVVGVDLAVDPDWVEIGVGESTQLEVIGAGPFTWSPTSGLSNGSSANPIASPATTTTYTVSMQVGGCTYSASVLVEVIRRILPPNTITPNGDGKNDVWLIVGIEDYPGAEVLIFDRWGQKVFSSTGYREPWDGTRNGNRLPDATYYYHIQLNQLEGRAPPYTGFISIVR
jgi:gliding motility-associated-like protein